MLFAYLPLGLNRAYWWTNLASLGPKNADVL